MMESETAEQLREMVREAEALRAPSDRTVLLCRREVDPETGRAVVSWWVEPDQTDDEDSPSSGPRGRISTSSDEVARAVAGFPLSAGMTEGVGMTGNGDDGERG
ncbi:MAG TPA: hypothetical protein VIZ17_10665 [Acetobacteraceae bacterium]